MRKNSAFLGLVVLFLLVSCSSRELVSNVPEKKIPERYPTQGILHFMYGEIYRVEGNYPYANMEYRRALEFDTTATILKAVGESYFLMGKPSQATGFYEKALKMDPHDQDAEFHLLDLYINELRYEEAVQLIEKRLKTEPDNLEYLQRLAECYRNISQPDKALTVLDHMINLDPDHPWPYVYAAEILLENDRIAEAAPYLDRVARRVPPNDQLYEFWVRSLFESQNVSGMLEALEYWLSQNPEDLSPYFLYIDYQYRMKNFEKGDSLLSVIANRWQESSRIPYFSGLSAMAKDQPESVWHFFTIADGFGDGQTDLYLYYGLWFWERGDLERAEKIADRAIEQLGADVRWVHMKAMINAQKGNYNLAESLLKKIIEADSTNLSVREDLANIYIETGEADLADRLYGELLNELPENATILNNYAYALARLDRDPDRAIKMVNKALKIEKITAYYDTKAWVLYRQHKYNQALQWVGKALKYPDAGSEVLYHKGEILIALDRKDEAKKTFHEALMTDPENSDAIKALEELK